MKAKAKVEKTFMFQDKGLRDFCSIKAQAGRVKRKLRWKRSKHVQLVLPSFCEMLFNVPSTALIIFQRSISNTSLLRVFRCKLTSHKIVAFETADADSGASIKRPLYIENKSSFSKKFLFLSANRQEDLFSLIPKDIVLSLDVWTAWRSKIFSHFRISRLLKLAKYQEKILFVFQVGILKLFVLFYFIIFISFFMNLIF